MKSPTRKRLAGLAAFLVGSGTAVGLAAAPAEAQTTEYPVVDGSVSWGVRESFRDYLGGPIANGETTVIAPAAENADGTFTFPVTDGAYHADTHDTESRSEGAVHFTGHGGQLDLTFANLRVETDYAAESGMLYLDVTDADGTVTDVPFAELDTAGLEWGRGDYNELAGIPAVLTAEGAEAFAGFYGEGAELDPVTVAFKTGEPSTGDPSSEVPSDDPTGESPTAEDPSSETPTEEPATVYDITGGDADWGVKESYRQYVTGPIANGEITVVEPAAENADGTYRFPEATGTFTAETCAIDAAFAGGVNFYGHEGQMDLDVADLSVKSVDGGLALYSGATHVADVAVTELAVADGAITVDGAAAAVSADGVAFFGGFYTEGTALDPVSFAVELADAPDTTCEPTGDTPAGPGGTDSPSTGTSGAGSPKLPTTGSPLAIVLAAATALLAGGAAVMVLARRRALHAEA